MEKIETVTRLWNDIGSQYWSKLTRYFTETAVIEWPNTNEYFTPEEWKTANEQYPGKWNTEIKSRFTNVDTVITVTLISNDADDLSLYATSFFQFKDDRIVYLTEYFSENVLPPAWRTALCISEIVKKNG